MAEFPLTIEESRGGTALKGRTPHNGRSNKFLSLSIWLPWSLAKTK
jgi:hypothetical protein